MADTPPPPVPLPGTPPGYEPGTNLSSATVAYAHQVLNNSAYQYGDRVHQTFDGIDYIFQVEPHYDDHAGGGLRWHRGVTVFQPAGTGPQPKTPGTKSPSAEPVAAPELSMATRVASVVAGAMLGGGIVAAARLASRNRTTHH